jgi:hypothetical protein
LFRAFPKSTSKYSKPLLIRLQLIMMWIIQIEIWKMKNSVDSWVHTLKDTWDLGARGIRARGLSDCVEGSWRDWDHARKYPRLTWAGWRRPWISAYERVIHFCSDIFFNNFHQHYLITKFSMFSNFFLSIRDTVRFINPDGLSHSQLIRISEGLLYYQYSQNRHDTVKQKTSCSLVTHYV